MNKIISLIIGGCLLLSGCNKNNKGEITKEEAFRIYETTITTTSELVQNVINGSQSFYGSREYSQVSKDNISSNIKTAFAIDYNTNECLNIYNIDDIRSGSYSKYDIDNELLNFYYLPNLENYIFNGNDPKDTNSALYKWNEMTKEIKNSFISLIYLHKEIEIFFNYTDEHINYYSSKEGELRIEYKYEDMFYSYYFEDYLPKELKNTYYNLATEMSCSNTLYFSLTPNEFMPKVN